FEGKIGDDDYDKDLKRLQFQLQIIQAAYMRQGLRGLITLEGWDASGKGGLIQRMTAETDPRFTKVWSIGAPSKEELAHHFLWRFWTRLPADREVAVFDRSWYGRVLVERVDRLTPDKIWQRAYDEINAFEQTQIDCGTRLVKLFLHTTQAEQDKRLRERLDVPYKRWKTGLDDYHNRSRRAEYLDAYADMFGRCNPRHAPWVVIAANDKKYTRLTGLQAIVDALGAGVDLGYPEISPELRAVAEAALGPIGTGRGKNGSGKV
ncbi:MAG: polyphosphate kinase 2 family protein, partial [Polymorphobacter sp.]